MACVIVCFVRVGFVKGTPTLYPSPQGGSLQNWLFVIQSSWFGGGLMSGQLGFGDGWISARVGHNAML
ncbi:hypothetical protein, partial [Aliihoeflea sp.]|uniref:hypothetical protein n=1 Tax=Aliihoeflea sp. TaxID=2608088 RepID=UPI0040376CA5